MKVTEQGLTLNALDLTRGHRRDTTDGQSSGFVPKYVEIHSLTHHPCYLPASLGFSALTFFLILLFTLLPPTQIWWAGICKVLRTDPGTRYALGTLASVISSQLIASPRLNPPRLALNAKSFIFNPDLSPIYSHLWSTRLLSLSLPTWNY